MTDIQNIRYIAEVDEVTGKIIQILQPQQDIPNEGLSDDGTRRIVYITALNLHEPNLAVFIQNWWFNPTNLEFFEVGEAPNRHATWSLSSSSWTWNADALLADIRLHRNARIARSDWTQLGDTSLTDSQVAEARTYRTALRNLTTNLDNPSSVESVSWPTPPSFLQ